MQAHRSAPADSKPRDTQPSTPGVLVRREGPRGWAERSQGEGGRLRSRREASGETSATDTLTLDSRLPDWGESVCGLPCGGPSRFLGEFAPEP